MNQATGLRLDRKLIYTIAQGLGLGFLLAIAFAAGYLYCDAISRPERTGTSFVLLSEADAILAKNYVNPLPDDRVRVHGAIKGLVASLNDPYTIFVEPQTAKVDSTTLAGRFGGIGVEISRDAQSQFVISKVYAENPAALAGVKEGDVITAVDGKSVDTQVPDDTSLLAAIRGDVGTTVTLTILRGDQVVEFKIVRAEIVIPSTFWKMANADQHVGYIAINRFTDRTPEELAQAIKELRALGAGAFILDLRDNGGGLVDSAVKVASQFLDGGVVLYERTKGSKDQVFNASQDGTAYFDPLLVLVNQNTASAAEIVAGALQDRGRARLIGQKTFGKGSVQLILPLSDGSSIHVTTAEWLTPNRHPLQGIGLTPDIVLTPIAGKDVALDTAISELTSKK